MIYGVQIVTGPKPDVVAQLNEHAGPLSAGTDDEHEHQVVAEHFAHAVAMVERITEGLPADVEVWVEVSGAMNEAGNRLTLTVALV